MRYLFCSFPFLASAQLEKCIGFTDLSQWALVLNKLDYQFVSSCFFPFSRSNTRLYNRNMNWDQLFRSGFLFQHFLISNHLWCLQLNFSIKINNSRTLDHVSECQWPPSSAASPSTSRTRILLHRLPPPVPRRVPDRRSDVEGSPPRLIPREGGSHFSMDLLLEGIRTRFICNQLLFVDGGGARTEVCRIWWRSVVGENGWKEMTAELIETLWNWETIFVKKLRK